MSIKGRFFAAAFDSEEKKFLKELDSFICSQKKNGVTSVEYLKRSLTDRAVELLDESKYKHFGFAIKLMAESEHMNLFDWVYNRLLYGVEECF